MKNTTTIILVRHGQYKKKDKLQKEELTPLGRRQAKLTGQKLKEYKYDQIITSSMPRAVETCAIINKSLKFKKKIISTKLLHECVPGFPVKLRKKYGYTDSNKLKSMKKRLDTAFKKYFNIPKKNQTLLLVCHGNVMRYLICKSLKIDTLKWLELDISQCGISILKIKNYGDQKYKLISHNETGHIPLAERTFI